MLPMGWVTATNEGSWFKSQQLKFFFQFIIYKNYKTFTFYDFKTKESESLKLHFKEFVMVTHPSSTITKAT